MAAYRPDQGIYARVVAGGTVLLLGLFASVRVFHLTFDETGARIPLLGLKVAPAAIWASGLFIVLAFVTFLFTYGLRTGLAALDKGSHALIDLLIDTQAELAKVSWPGKEELTRSTVAVLVSIVLLGVFLVSVDWLVISALRILRVLPMP